MKDGVHTDLGLDLGERESKSPALPQPWSWRSVSGSGDVSLTIFIASVRGGESLASFVNRFFHFSG